MQKHNNNIKAIGRYMRLSTTKANRVLDQIRGKKYIEAIIILKFMPYRACNQIKKILESAAANAESNHGINKNELHIQEAFANQGPTMKRFQPRAQGRAFPIHKPTCHITLIVASTD